MRWTEDVPKFFILYDDSVSWKISLRRYRNTDIARSAAKHSSAKATSVVMDAKTQQERKLGVNSENT